MPTEPIVFPFNAGVREDVSSRAAQSPPHLEVIENYVIDKRGDFIPRGGFASVTVTSTDSGNPAIPSPRHLFSTGRELCAVTAHDLYGRLDEKDRWAYRGAVSPGTGRVRTAFRDGFSYPLFDVDGSTSFALGAAEQSKRTDYDTSLTGAYSGVVRLARTESDDFQPLNYNTTTAELAGGSCRSVATGSFVFPLWMGSGSAPLDIKAGQYSLGSTAFPSSTTLVSGNVAAVGQGRVYDARGWDADGWVLAYVKDGSQEVILAKCNTTPAVTSSVAITDRDPYKRVAIAVDPGDDAIFVFVSADDNEAQADLLVYRYRYSTLGLVWGPVTVYTADDTPYTFTNLGIEVGTSDGSSRLGMVWTMVNSSISIEDNPIAMSAYVDADGTSLVGTAKHYNEVTWSRPFWHDGQLYSGTKSAVDQNLGADNPSVGFEYEPPEGNYVGDIFNLDLLVRWPSPEEVFDVGGLYVGAWNIGFSYYRDIGSCASVYSPSAGVFAWGNVSIGRQSLGYSPSLMSEEVRVDTNQTPIGRSVGESGCAVIGGTMAMWFDGELTMELGQMTLPVPFAFSEATSGGFFSQNDVRYYAANWISYDAAGYLHRGAPSFTVEKTLIDPGSTSLVKIQYHSTPSNRNLTRPNQAVIYRGETADDLRQVSPPDLAIVSPSDDHETAEFQDLNTVSDLSGRELLYVLGGELEAIHPEGARIPLVVDGRVWLGGFWRRNRVQYSKPINPGTGSEINIAPEFNEGFAMTLDGDDEVTGLATLDRNLVIFTSGAVYLNTGEGPGDDGSNPNGFSGPQRVSSDAGCVEARSVVAYPEGVLFQSAAGIYQLDRGHTVRFIGDPVRDQLASFPIVTSATVVPADSHVRFTVTNAAEDDGRILVYDYRAQAWLVWDVSEDDVGTRLVPVAGCLHENTYYVASAGGLVFSYDTTATDDAGGGTITKKVTTGWIQASAHGGYHRVQNVHLLGELMGNANLTLTVSTNFDPDAGSDQSVTWDNATLAALPRTPDVLVRLKPKDQKGHAHQITITDTGTGAGLRLSGLRFDVTRRRDAGKNALAAK